MYLRKMLTAVLLGAAAGLNADVEITVNPLQARNFTDRDDVAKLKELTLAVGREFSPDRASNAALKKIGIRRIRCINVDLLPGQFDPKGIYRIDTARPNRLDANLATCAEINAIPHIIIGERMPDALRVKINYKDDQSRTMGGGRRRDYYGPTDYRLYRNYWQAFFEYVLITRGFRNAEFEVFNEPDIGGVICPTAKMPAWGSGKLYYHMLNLYSEIAKAAEQFEAAHPGIRVRLGGPALAWAYTFRYGSFNWGNQFIKDCAARKLRIDFIGVHFYGNIASLNREYPAHFPSFLEMLNQLKQTRDRDLPGVPIRFTEWGPSYHVNSTEQAMINADHIGTAWSMEFLKTILENGVDGAIYLVTTDLMTVKNGQKSNVWGWCSLMVNPQVYGHPFPKAPYHLFTLIAALRGTRVESTRNDSVNSFAAAAPDRKQLQVLLWNYAARIPEKGLPQDAARTVNLRLVIPNAEKFFRSPAVKVTVRIIDQTRGDAYQLYKKGVPLTAENTALPVEIRPRVPLKNRQLELPVTLTPSSVALLEFSPAP